MTRLTSLVAIAVAALALAAPALADVKASHPGDVKSGRPADAFARDYFRDSFRVHPGSGSWRSLRPLGDKWIALGSSWS